MFKERGVAMALSRQGQPAWRSIQMRPGPCPQRPPHHTHTHTRHTHTHQTHTQSHTHTHHRPGPCPQCLPRHTHTHTLQYTLVFLGKGLIPAKNANQGFSKGRPGDTEQNRAGLPVWQWSWAPPWHSGQPLEAWAAGISPATRSYRLHLPWCPPKYPCLCVPRPREGQETLVESVSLKRKG